MNKKSEIETKSAVFREAKINYYIKPILLSNIVEQIILFTKLS